MLSCDHRYSIIFRFPYKLYLPLSLFALGNIHNFFFFLPSLELDFCLILREEKKKKKPVE